jgi:hypothetical protein
MRMVIESVEGPPLILPRTLAYVFAASPSEPTYSLSLQLIDRFADSPSADRFTEQSRPSGYRRTTCKTLQRLLLMLTEHKPLSALVHASVEIAIRISPSEG